MTCEACGTSVKALEAEVSSSLARYCSVLNCTYVSNYLCSKAHSASCTAADAEVTCPACSSTITFGALRAHTTTECPATIIPCTEVAHGCPWTGKRNTLSTHTITCPFTVLSPYFAIADKQTKTLVGENTVLNLRLEAAEAKLNMMRAEMEVAKNALGPFWREPISHMHTGPRNIDLTADERINAQSSNDTSNHDIPQVTDTRLSVDSHQLGSTNTASSTVPSSRWRSPNGNTALISSSSSSPSSVPVASDPVPGTPVITEQDRIASYFPLQETEVDATARLPRETAASGSSGTTYSNTTSPDLNSTIGMRTYATGAHHAFASRLFPNPPIRYVNDGFAALSLASPPAGILSPAYTSLVAYPTPSLTSPPVPGPAHIPYPSASTSTSSTLTHPPLDTSQSLFETLSSLHTSTLHLTTALDALARRTDGALAAVDMRAGDEAGALRAAVHGLRMQVHALVTERAFGGMGPGILASNANPNAGTGTTGTGGRGAPLQGGGNYSNTHTRTHSPPPIRNTKL